MNTLLIATANHLNRVVCAALLLLGIATALPALAVPSFARQTGMDCAACHISFPELTPFGRSFKLNGYTLGEQQLFPLAVMAQFSVTNMNKQSTAGNAYMIRQNDPTFDGGSVFLASKITDYAGAFIQWTYENLGGFRGDNSVNHHSHADNADIRIVGHADIMDKDLTFGLNLNNNPSVQDVWNTTPAWSYPFNSSKMVLLGGPVTGAANRPSFATQIDGGLAQKVEGMGAYFFWDRHLYGELSFYGTADKIFRPLSAGTGITRPTPPTALSLAATTLTGA